MSKISLKNVSVSFAEQLALKDIELEILAGDSLAVIGPSGHGKTTLLKTLAGLITPCKGEVLFEQRNVATLSNKERGEFLKKVGMLFQKNALFDSLTCLNNIVFPLRESLQLSPTEVHHRAQDYLLAVGLENVEELFPDELSGGMQKRLGIARALALEPQIVFYDDPTAGLDPITSKKIINLILDLKRKKGSTIITITNDMNRAYQIADKICMLYHGQIIFLGTPQEIQKETDPRVKQFIQGLAQGPLVSDVI